MSKLYVLSLLIENSIKWFAMDDTDKMYLLAIIRYLPTIDLSEGKTIKTIDEMIEEMDNSPDRKWKFYWGARAALEQFKEKIIS